MWISLAFLVPVLAVPLLLCVQTGMIFLLLVWHPYINKFKGRISLMRKIVEALNAHAMLTFALAMAGVPYLTQLLEYVNVAMLLIYAFGSMWIALCGSRGSTVSTDSARSNKTGKCSCR